MTTRRLIAMGVWLVLVCCASPAAAQPPVPDTTLASVQDLKRLSIEELAELDVHAVARRVQRLSDTAAAVSVLRTEDIRRTGYVTLPDALRAADGLDVGRVSPIAWAISARGFNINQANKMLVLFDGRSLYSPLAGGTFWDAQDYFLPDIDRIEVVRGPGGATWGANAVNGVISITSKSAADTRGSMAVVSAGFSEQATLAARHGDRLGQAGSYRVYGRFRRQGGQLTARGEALDNHVQAGQAGFRMDSGSLTVNRWTLQGDVYLGRQGVHGREDGATAGGNMLGRWTRRLSGAADVQVQAYYDRSYRHTPGQFRAVRDTWDLEVQHTRQPGPRHHLVLGGGFRVTHGHDRGMAGVFFDPPEKTDGLFSVFAQDEITLRPNRLFLTLGAKLERNDFTGFEHQPTVRLRWSGERQTLWGAVSRAVRLPTRADTDVRVVSQVTGGVTLQGSRDFESEEVLAYEAGYRVRPHDRASVDVAVFANRYDDLRSTDLMFRPEPVIVLGNRLNARTSGIEVSTALQAAPAWQIHGSYAYFQKSFSFDGPPDFQRGTIEGNDPAHRFLLRSYLDLPRGFAFDSVLRHRTARPQPYTPPHTELNLRLGWVSPRVELSLVGQHLLDRVNKEFFRTTDPLAFRRGVYLRSVWRF